MLSKWVIQNKWWCLVPQLIKMLSNLFGSMIQNFFDKLIWIQYSKFFYRYMKDPKFVDLTEGQKFKLPTNIDHCVSFKLNEHSKCYWF